MTDKEKIIPKYIDNDIIYNNLIKEFNKINDTINIKQTEIEEMDDCRKKIIIKIKNHLNIE